MTCKYLYLKCRYLTEMRVTIYNLIENKDICISNVDIGISVKYISISITNICISIIDTCNYKTHIDIRI